MVFTVSPKPVGIYRMMGILTKLKVSYSTKDSAVVQGSTLGH